MGGDVRQGLSLSGAGNGLIALGWLGLFLSGFWFYGAGMSVDIDIIFHRGGKRLLDLLDYCVRSVQLDPLFLFLIREYRQQPTTPRAIVLYDVFCAVDAPVRLTVREVLPPQDLRLEAAVRPWRGNGGCVQGAGVASVSTSGSVLLLPPKYLFDGVEARVRAASPALRHIRRHYRLRRTPIENLPGGRMSAAQRRFLDQVWQPRLRPRLMAVGFRHVTTLG